MFKYPSKTAKRAILKARVLYVGVGLLIFGLGLLLFTAIPDLRSSDLVAVSLMCAALGIAIVIRGTLVGSSNRVIGAFTAQEAAIQAAKEKGPPVVPEWSQTIRPSFDLPYGFMLVLVAMILGLEFFDSGTSGVLQFSGVLGLLVLLWHSPHVLQHVLIDGTLHTRVLRIGYPIRTLDLALARSFRVDGSLVFYDGNGEVLGRYPLHTHDWSRLIAWAKAELVEIPRARISGASMERSD